MSSTSAKAAASSNAELQIGASDFPALQKSFSDAAKRAQAAHFSSQKVLLWILVAIAIASCFGQLSPLLWEKDISSTVEKMLCGLGALLYFASLLLAVLQQQQSKPEDWYDARALAESAKSIAWKFMMRAEPYGGEDADTVLQNDLRKLLSDAKKPPLNTGGEQITPKMREARGRTIAERFNIYNAGRIQDQLSWYTRRSKEHDGANFRWQWIIVALFGLALVLSVVAVSNPPAGAIAAVAAAAAPCAIAWTQIHRHRDLAHSYSFTSHEIGLLSSAATPPENEEKIARLVADCENAFSREHTMWRARRETTKD